MLTRDKTTSQPQPTKHPDETVVSSASKLTDNYNILETTFMHLPPMKIVIHTQRTAYILPRGAYA